MIPVMRTVKMKCCGLWKLPEEKGNELKYVPGIPSS
jgi:hypothetical protein